MLRKITGKQILVAILVALFLLVSVLALTGRLGNNRANQIVELDYTLNVEKPESSLVNEDTSHEDTSGESKTETDEESEISSRPEDSPSLPGEPQNSVPEPGTQAITPYALDSATTEEEIQQAIAGITDTGTITVAADIELTGTLTIPVGKTITLTSPSPSTYTISPAAGFTGGNRLLDVHGNCSVENLAFDGTNRSAGLSVSGGTLYFGTGAVVRNTTTTSNGAGILVVNGGHLEVNGGEISDNTAPFGNGGGINVFDSTAVLLDGKITGNSANWGGGVSVNSQNGNLDAESTFTMLDGLIDGNMATTQYGGGVYVSLRGTFALSGGTISNNSARSGAGIFLGQASLLPVERELQQTCTLDMNGGTVSGNTAARFGGGIYAQWNSHATINDGVITRNTAGDAGGGIGLATPTSYDYYSVALHLSGGEISHNAATSSVGGGIYADATTYPGRLMQVVIGKENDASAGPQIHSNSTSMYGGGAWLVGRIDAQLLSGAVYENQALQGAGGGFAIYNDVDFSMAGGRVYGNTAATNGGGFCLLGTAKAALANGTVSGNAADNGGGIYTEVQNTTLSGLTLSANSATHGGGVYVTSAAGLSATNGTTWAGNTAASEGGGLYTADYSYTNPADTTRYGNIQLDGTSIFSGNTADGAYNPPSNAEAFTGIAFTRSSIGTGAGWLHPLNNYDINYASPPLLVLYTVTYNANGGSGSYTDGAFPQGTTYTVLPAGSTGISRAQYTFTGWNTQANGMGTAYTAGATFTIEEDTTLYAMWEPTPEPELFTVLYYRNDGTAAVYHTQKNVEPCSTLASTKPAVPAREGYTFTGWYTTASTQTLWDFENGKIVQDTSLYAGWAPVTTSTESGGGAGTTTTTSIGATTSSTGGAQTGDSSPIGILVLLLVVAAAGIIALFALRYKRKRK